MCFKRVLTIVSDRKGGHNVVAPARRCTRSMRVGSRAVSGGDPASDGLQSGYAKISLSPYPGEEFHRHDGTRWKERTETVLTKLGLLIVAITVMIQLHVRQ